MTSPHNNLEPHPTEHATNMELDTHEWNALMDDLIARDARIIAFRGAGAVNGIDPVSAEAATTQLAAYVSELAESGHTVALMFDGDEDNRQKPDIGSVFGMLVDSLKDKPNVVAITAQSKSWYYPKTEGGALESSTGTPYETYVFPDELPGSHAALTQSEKLVAYPRYEQVFVGPAGPIAFSQLADLSSKATNRPAEAGPLHVIVIETSNNASLAEGLQQQLESAQDDAAKEKIAAKITQREKHPYGALFTLDGQFAVDLSEYPGLEFQIVPVEAE
jgi:hypothetical protein